MLKNCHFDLHRHRLKAGWTLIEILVACAISTLVMASLMVVTVFTLRSFMAVGNYGTLNQSSRYALDLMSRDIRNAAGLTAGTTNNITLTNLNGDSFSYNW